MSPRRVLWGICSSSSAPGSPASLILSLDNMKALGNWGPLPHPHCRKPGRNEGLLKLVLRGWLGLFSASGVPTDNSAGLPFSCQWEENLRPETHSKATGNIPIILFLCLPAVWSHQWLCFAPISIDTKCDLVFPVPKAPVLRFCLVCLERKQNQQT